MTAPELLMSESQERMMAFVHPDLVQAVLDVAGKWEIDSAVVGVVKEGGLLTVRYQDEIVAEMPAASLADAAPLYHRPLSRPDWLDEVWSADPGVLDADAGTLLLQLLDDPAVGSTAWVHEQYDHMLFLNTVVGPGSDGSLIRIRGTEKGLAVSTDGNGRMCRLDPREGSARLVFEAALNVAVTGARPMALVDNLNFGNPEKPEVMWQFRESVEGISEACEALSIPVVGGNVSFYNESEGEDIHPTPVVGLLGLAEPIPAVPPRLSAAREGMEIWEIGPAPGPNLAGSVAQRVFLDRLAGRPAAPDPVMAGRMVDLVIGLAQVVPVLHDVSDGGRAVALAEICIASGVGATIAGDEVARHFSEDPHRVIAVFESGAVQLPADISRKLGVVGGDTLTIGDSDPVEVETMRRIWLDALPTRMAG